MDRPQNNFCLTPTAINIPSLIVTRKLIDPSLSADAGDSFHPRIQLISNKRLLQESLRSNNECSDQPVRRVSQLRRDRAEPRIRFASGFCLENFFLQVSILRIELKVIIVARRHETRTVKTDFQSFVAQRTDNCLRRSLRKKNLSQVRLTFSERSDV